MLEYLGYLFYVILLLKIFEGFRSVDCFRLGWPMRADADFFCVSEKSRDFEKSGVSCK